MEQHKRITTSQGDYLETILLLEGEEKQVRVTDIASHLDLSKASVNKAMQLLKEAGYVDHQRYGTISLTDHGRYHAREIFERHMLFRRFLTEVLGVDDETAEQDACEMEHCVSGTTMQAFTAFMKAYDERV